MKSSLFNNRIPSMRFFYIAIFLLCTSNFANAQNEGQSDFEKEISNLGFDAESTTDWSDQKKINIEIPTCAYVNITGITSLPPKKKDTPAWLEFYDGNGNYFKKRVLMKVQGKGSTQWPKKNFALDFCEDEWIGDKTPDIKFGNWVKQDGFHVKAYYMDKFRGTGAIGYKVYEMIIAGRGEKPWNRAGLAKPDAEARCFPDGFPVILYCNGEFYGVYSWQLKKHRKNMNQDKNNPLQIHLDGNIRASTLFSTDNINWTTFEVRAPKSLYNMDGTVYNGDSPKELMDETSPYYDLPEDDESVKEIKRNTAIVKHNIEQLRNHWFEMQDVIASGASKEEIRAEIAKRFDVPGIIDYIIHNLLTNNLDGLERNWQWFTYDGYKWFVTPYDLDATFGYHTNYFIVFPPENYALGSLLSRTWKGKKEPLGLVHKYFEDDIYAYYADIRKRGLLTADGVVSLFDKWYYSVGENNYDKEWEKWSDCPFTLETILNPNWRLHEWSNSVYDKCIAYDPNTTYHTGDLCKLSFRIWEATGTTTGVQPYSQLGCQDDIGRIHTWVPTHMEYLDKWMKYTPTDEMTSFSLQIPASGWATICVPFAFDIPNGVEVYNVTGFVSETNLAKLEAVTQVEANKPYLIKGAPGNYLLSGKKVQADDTSSDYLVNGLLHGTYSAISTMPEQYLLFTNETEPGFYTAKDNTTTVVAPNTAYLMLNGTLSKPDVVYLSTEEEVPSNITVNISTAGFGTYCSNYGLNFTDVEGIKAYVVYAYNKTTGKIKAARVEETPANTGLLILGSPGEYSIPTDIASSYYMVNMLVGTTEEIFLTKTDGEFTNLILTSSNGSPAFVKLSNDGPFAANKAYLQIPTILFDSNANVVEIEFEDDTDSIVNISTDETDAPYYTISGIKTKKPTKGIYIKSGKKVVR